MAKYHGNDNRNSPVVLFEYREMCEDISKTGSDKRWWDYRELWNSREVGLDRTPLSSVEALAWKLTLH